MSPKSFDGDRSPGRNIVYFLGAGASRAAGACATVRAGRQLPIPLQTDFWDVFLRFVRKPATRKLIEDFLFRYFLGHAQAQPRLSAAKRRALLASVEVEEVFTFLSERVRAPSSSHDRAELQRIWEILVAELGTVFARFSANKATRQVYRKLLTQHVRKQDTVVSFNYDTVFEWSMPPKYDWGYEGLDDCRKRLRILKPHGSISWRRNGDSIDHGLVDDAVVVAPTQLKFVSALGTDAAALAGYLDQSPQLAALWSAMEAQMRRAKALVFIGYSFPGSDMYFASLLRSVLASRTHAPGIVLVNPDAPAIAERLSTRFAIHDALHVSDLRELLGMTRPQLLRRLA